MMFGHTLQARPGSPSATLDTQRAQHEAGLRRHNVQLCTRLRCLPSREVCTYLHLLHLGHIWVDCSHMLDSKEGGSCEGAGRRSGNRQRLPPNAAPAQPAPQPLLGLGSLFPRKWMEGYFYPSTSPVSRSRKTEPEASLSNLCSASDCNWPSSRYHPLSPLAHFTHHGNRH